MREPNRPPTCSSIATSSPDRGRLRKSNFTILRFLGGSTFSILSRALMRLWTCAALAVCAEKRSMKRCSFARFACCLLRETKLSVSGGVHTTADAIETVMCGASAVQVVAGVLRSGPERLRTMRVEMQS